ncbi:MAG: DUF434 domain-containing protein [Thermodesulfobacteriota bacterium]
MNSLAKKSLTVKPLKFKDLQKAARDFRFLLNRGYPRKAALELVGNRYGLTSDERHLLHRGVFSDSDSESRRKKKVFLGDVLNQDLVIDGHNVLITIEAGISGRPLILGDDGFIRDISGVSGNFKKTETTEKAIQFIIRAIKKMRPTQTLFLLDAPISKSGELAEAVRNYLKKEGISGDAMALRVPERILIGFPGVVATSDTAIINRSKKVLDLAGHVLRKSIELESLIRLNRNERSVRKR